MNQLQQKIILKNTKLNRFKIKAALKRLAAFKIGDMVRVTWEVDAAYGGGTRSHEGPIASIDDWIRVEPTNRSPGHYYMPITRLSNVEGLTLEHVD